MAFLGAAFFAAAFLAGAFLAGAFFAAAFFAGAFAAVLTAVLRGGYLLTRGSNSNATLSSSAFHAKNALNGRRVRMDTNLSSRSVLPVVNSF